MRKIEIRAGVNTDTTRIFVDGVRLETFFDNNATKFFSLNKRKLPPATGASLLDTMRKKLGNDVVNLTKSEIDFIVDEFKKVLGL
jgi:hypothetical protein